MGKTFPFKAICSTITKMNALVVGSSLIDFFVQIEKNDTVVIDEKTVTVPLGAKLPIDIRSLSLGGNGSNVSTGLQKLSIQTSFYTYLGTDPLSSHIKTKLSETGISLIVENVSTTTGSLSLIFDFPTDRVIFSHHNPADHSFDETKIPVKPDIIYLTSIGEEWINAYEKVLSYAQTNNISVAFSPGSKQMLDMNETFIKAVHQSKILLCNLEEATKIFKTLTKDDSKDPKDIILGIKNLGFSILSITDGANGAYALGENGTIYKINTPSSGGAEKTGAGDAYAAGFLSAYLYQKDIPEGMKWGTLNALGEMAQVGAQTGQLTLEQMEQKSNEAAELIIETI